MLTFYKEILLFCDLQILYLQLSSRFFLATGPGCGS